ncbi:hypothetical protein D039_0287A, partial [Vibrio parahaemolyticus EKP-028]
MKSTGEQQA